MNKTEIKLYSDAYDSLYNLDSFKNYKYNFFLELLIAEVESKGYEFVLNEKTQKFKVKKVHK